MRPVTAGLFRSVDGVVEAPNLWQGDSFDAELGALLGDVMSRVDTVLLGRVAYQEWSDYWPSATDPFAGFINVVPKFVASSTLTGPLAWQNATLIDGDVEAFVADLKQGDGGEIAVMGGITLARNLFDAGLLDELTFMTHPVVAGSGRTFFGPADAAVRLRLVRQQTTGAGNDVVTYAHA